MKSTDHNFQNLRKQEWRVTNLEFLKSHGRLIWEVSPESGLGVLKPHVLELLGESGYLSYQTLKPYLANPEKDFIGANKDSKSALIALKQSNPQEWLDEEQRAKMRDLEPCPFQLRYGDLSEMLVSKHSKDYASVINWDDMAYCAHSPWWLGYGERLHEALKRHSKVHGEVALILNLSLRQPKTTKEVWADNLRVFRGHLARMFHVKPELILEDVNVARAEDPFGFYQSIQIYEGRKKTPMVTFRAIYDAQGHHRLYNHATKGKS